MEKITTKDYEEADEQNHTFTVKFYVEVCGENSRQEAKEWLISNVIHRIQVHHQYPFDIEEE